MKLVVLLQGLVGQKLGLQTDVAQKQYSKAGVMDDTKTWFLMVSSMLLVCVETKPRKLWL